MGEKEPNQWGLYDTHGNVDEWCLDGMRDHADEPVVDPIGPLDDIAHRAVRGGCWRYSARLCRSALRLAIVPGFRYRYLGFRLVAGQGQAPEQDQQVVGRKARSAGLRDAASSDELPATRVEQ